MDKIKFLEIGGSFIDNYGRGYINSFGHKDYTKFFKDDKITKDDKQEPSNN